MERLRRAVFVDRDGVINRDSPAFVKTPDEFVLLPGSALALARLSAAGLAVVVVTNQSGLSRGLVTPQALEEMHARLRQAVAACGGELAGIYHCPHLPGSGCPCRKPAPGLVLRASAELGLSPERSWMVGDKYDDVLLGRGRGCRTVLVLSGQTTAEAAAGWPVQPDHVAPDLPAAAAWVLEGVAGGTAV